METRIFPDAETCHCRPDGPKDECRWFAARTTRAGVRPTVHGSEQLKVTLLFGEWLKHGLQSIKCADQLNELHIAQGEGRSQRRCRPAEEDVASVLRYTEQGIATVRSGLDSFAKGQQLSQLRLNNRRRSPRTTPQAYSPTDRKPSHLNSPGANATC